MKSEASGNIATILKLSPAQSSDDRELSFDLDFFASLTTEQRFKLMFERSREMAELLRQHGHAEAPSIAKRT